MEGFARSMSECIMSFVSLLQRVPAERAAAAHCRERVNGELTTKGLPFATMLIRRADA